MKKTLESFIDPINIPKKYGGGLDFEFGQMPSLDPALASVLNWEGEYKDFPKGPMYWEKTGEKDEIVALAVGHIEEKQRKERVCTVTRKLDLEIPPPVAVNGHAESPKVESASLALPKELLEAPTVPATPDVERVNPLKGNPVAEDPELVKATEKLALERNGATKAPNGAAVSGEKVVS